MSTNELTKRIAEAKKQNDKKVRARQRAKVKNNEMAGIKRSLREVVREG